MEAKELLNTNTDDLLIKKSRLINFFGSFYFFCFSSMSFLLALYFLFFKTEGNPLLNTLFGIVFAVASITLIWGIIHNFKKMFDPNPKLHISNQFLTYYFVNKNDFISIPLSLISQIKIIKRDTPDFHPELGEIIERYIYLSVELNTQHPEFMTFKKDNHVAFKMFKNNAFKLNINNMECFKLKTLENYTDNLTFT